MQKHKIEIFCKVSIEEACNKHKIEITILKVMSNHAHMIVDCPRTMSDAQLMQIIKGLSSYLLFRMCENLRKRYSNGHFWNAGYFCCSVGRDFDSVCSYVENQ